jgi:DNA-directed RNA polymerase subunit RPC12/RpoP
MFCQNCGADAGSAVFCPNCGKNLSGTPAAQTIVQVAPTQQQGGLACPKCGSTNTSVSVNTYAKSKHRSLLWNIFMICITAGIWIIWMIIRKRKEKIVTQKTAVCNNCAHSWKV